MDGAGVGSSESTKLESDSVSGTVGGSVSGPASCCVLGPASDCVDADCTEGGNGPSVAVEG